MHGKHVLPVDEAGEDSDCGRDADRTRRVLSSIGAEVDSQRLANPVAIRSVDERTGFSMSIEPGLAVGDRDAEGVSILATVTLRNGESQENLLRRLRKQVTRIGC